MRLDPAERLVRQAVEQGKGRRCSDPIVMARIAAALTVGETEHKGRRHASKPATKKEASRGRGKTSH